MARKFAFDVVDVFTDRPFGGNQLAVVYEADALTSEQMHAIAAEFNFAETTFVLRPTLPEADFQVRIFTPLVELPFAGHPTVGTAVAATIRQGRLSSVAHKLVLQETVGPILVHVRSSDTLAVAELQLETVVEVDESRDARLSAVVANLVGTPRGSVLDYWAASAGVPFFFVQLDSRESVDACSLQREVWAQHLSTRWAKHVFIFAVNSFEDASLYARMFAPASGIAEDPATGAAAAALVGSLSGRPHAPSDARRLLIQQGVLMGRPSQIAASWLGSHGGRSRLAVSGGVVPFASGHLSI